MSQTIISVLGAGGWGIAISNLLANKGHVVNLWEFEKAAAENLATTRTLSSKLPGIVLMPSVSVTNDLHEAVKAADFILFVVPSQTLRSVATKFKEINFGKPPIMVNLAKGIEVGSLKRMSEVLEENIPPRFYSGICTLSGPSHAEEVSRGIPTAIVVASKSENAAKMAQEMLMTSRFRVYTSTDILGVELAGSLKNIIALAAGMLDGLGMGDNTRGALLTRGLAEMVRMGRIMGANPLTFSGLSGIGDLVTTCLSKHSRNRFVGEQIGLGRKLSEILANMTMVAEGVETTRSGYALGQKLQIEMPITIEVHRVLFENKPPIEAINDLMIRHPKSEG